MDIYNVLTKIPYIIMLLAATALLFQIYYGGLLNLDTQIDQSQKSEFERTVVLENLLSVSLRSSEIQQLDYRFEHRRAVIPVEMFNSTEANGLLGVRKEGPHCYIPRVAGLDGGRYAMFARPLEDPQENADDPAETVLDDCTEPPVDTDPSRISYAPALLARGANGNPYLPVRLYVYEVQDGS
jgi:hypothetical protein